MCCVDCINVSPAFQPLDDLIFVAITTRADESLIFIGPGWIAIKSTAEKNANKHHDKHQPHLQVQHDRMVHAATSADYVIVQLQHLWLLVRNIHLFQDQPSRESAEELKEVVQSQIFSGPARGNLLWSVPRRLQHNDAEEHRDEDRKEDENNALPDLLLLHHHQAAALFSSHFIDWSSQPSRGTASPLAAIWQHGYFDHPFLIRCIPRHM